MKEKEEIIMEVTLPQAIYGIVMFIPLIIYLTVIHVIILPFNVFLAPTGKRFRTTIKDI